MKDRDRRLYGVYGYAVPTTTIRIPSGSEDSVRQFLKHYAEIRAAFRYREKDTRNWVEYHRLCKALDEKIQIWRP